MIPERRGLQSPRLQFPHDHGFALRGSAAWYITSAESRALQRAALLVLSLCVVRAVAGLRSTDTVTPHQGAHSEAGTLLADSDEKRGEETRRRRPLSAEEKIDPNTAGEEELDRLPGVGPSAARGIVRLREEVGGFSAAVDLLAVPGIGPATLARMEPFLEWPGPTFGRTRRRPDRPEGTGVGAPLKRAPIDLNRANQKDLETLPGVGPALASRILALRDTLGRFRNPDDLVRVRGVGPKTVARLKALVFVGG